MEGELTDTLELGVLVDDAGHMEERNEWLVGGLDQQELEGITVEGDAFEGGDNAVHDCATSNCGRKMMARFNRRVELDELLPTPWISLSEKTPSSWKLAKARAWSMSVGGRR